MVGPHTVHTAERVARGVGTPSAEGMAENMALFREVNGGPGQASPTTPSGAPISEEEQRRTRA
jgi:hypothetical protein